MASDQVDGLDVKPGMRIRHPQGGILRVTGAARRKGAGGQITNTVQVENEQGQRGYLELRAGQTFPRVPRED